MHHAIPGLLLIASCSVVAQPRAAKLEFEVASVKLSPPPDFDKGFLVSVTGGPGTASPELFRCVNMSLKGLVTQAYATTSFQVRTPEWMNSQMFDVSAKVPAGTTRGQFNVMLQNLLIDRFKLAVHNESKDQPKYDLVVARNGLKLKEAVEVPPGGRSRPALPKGRVGRYRPKETMESFAAYLTSQLGKFVNEATGLKGEYEINLSWVQDSTGQLDGSDSGPTLERALQEQLGLQLRATKGPVDFLVVDHADKLPSDN